MRSPLQRGTWTTALIGVLLAMGVFSSAQPADADKPIENPPYATAFFTANVGAFKILSRGPTPAQGTLTMTFAGTILVSGLQSGGKVTTSGNVRREYDNAQYGKQVYFGRGQITISGKFSGIQWFGRDMSAKFTGYAIARLFGEFDKKLETGRWWYADEPDKKRYWNPNGANQVSIPKDTAFQQARPAPGKRSKDD